MRSATPSKPTPEDGKTFTSINANTFCAPARSQSTTVLYRLIIPARSCAAMASRTSASLRPVRVASMAGEVRASRARMDRISSGEAGMVQRV